MKITQHSPNKHNSDIVTNWIFGIFYIPAQHKKASNHHANLPLEMYSFTL